MIGECPLSPLWHLAQLMDTQCGLARVRKRLVAFICARRAQPGNTVALAPVCVDGVDGGGYQAQNTRTHAVAVPWHCERARALAQSAMHAHERVHKS
jgi:hypothetical protein